MNKNESEQTRESGVGTHAVSFRVTEPQYQAFQALLRNVPGSDAGAMYREIFSRGLQSVEQHYEKHTVLSLDDFAAEVSQ
jgi:hypothetical protein